MAAEEEDMFQARWSFGRENFDRVRQLRSACFVEEQGVDEKEEFDAFDGVSAHLFVEDSSGQPIAVGRMFPDGETTRIGRICVAPAFRGQLYDDLVLRILLYKAEGLAGNTVVTCPQEKDAPFYERFGFAREGEPFFERNALRVRLYVPRDKIVWPKECGG
jgi:predicted GNAT family N-acyltransferase